MPGARRIAFLTIAIVLVITIIALFLQPSAVLPTYKKAGKLGHNPLSAPDKDKSPELSARKPFYKATPNDIAPPIQDNFPLAASAKRWSDLPSVPHWNKPKHVRENTPLFIGFTRNWAILQQAVVSYITAGWPPEDIYVIENTGTMASNKHRQLTLQNPFYIDHRRLTDIFGVNVITTPTLLTFAQLQNFFLFTATENDWPYYFWSHMDVVALPNERLNPYKSLYHSCVEVIRESMKPEYGRWAARFFAYDRLTLVNTAAYSEVGGFDPMIGFYATDCDFHERVAMYNYTMNDAFVGYIYDVGTSIPDLRALYREDDAASRSLCPKDTSKEKLQYGPGDCRFEALIRILDEVQQVKSQHEGGRNFWQGNQAGGQGEPFFTDPEGFNIAIKMTIEHGKAVYKEKWGHDGCDLRKSGLGPEDAWRVEHDWDRPPRDEQKQIE